MRGTATATVATITTVITIFAFFVNGIIVASLILNIIARNPISSEFRLKYRINGADANLLVRDGPDFSDALSIHLSQGENQRRH
jgi:hypothetical protein